MTILGENIFESNYTLRIIQSIRITSSSDLFGVKAGEDIGSHFVLSGRVDYRSHVWNTLDGQFERIDKPLDGMSFEEFLEYRPYMRRLEIKLKDLPEETPENLTFTISISYVPDVRMVESKSLKLYLFSFRSHGDFHEDVVNTIMKDLIKLMDPKYIEVTGLFTPRGGISIYPYANYGRPGTKWERLAEQRFATHE